MPNKTPKISKIPRVSRGHYPSRAAFKLLDAIEFFKTQYDLNLKDRICIDFGSSHGGFVKVLLESGAKRVYAIDVGYGILDYNLRINERVIVRERSNLRHLNLDWFIEADKLLLTKQSGAHFIFTADVSFISTRTVIDVIGKFSAKHQLALDALILIKPQFEDSKNVDKGIMRDEKLTQNAISLCIEKAKQSSFNVITTRKASIKGFQGNQEYILYITKNI